jgi:hypothetical protein
MVFSSYIYIMSHEEFLHNVAISNKEMVKKCLDRGANVNVKGTDGKTALIISIERKEIDLIRILINSGADVNLADNNGVSPLIYALLINPIDIRILNRLLEAGADVNLADNNGVSPLIYALLINPIDIRIVNMLLERNADPNTRDNLGISVYEYAQSTNNDDIVELIVDSGAQPDVENVVQPELPASNLFQVHHIFRDFEFDRFMEIIRTELGRREISLSTSGDELLEPLIDYATANLVREKVDVLNGINTKIKTYSDKNIRAVQDTIKYILAQPKEFINQYIDNFIIDCLHANSGVHSESCIPGQYERVFLSLHHVFFAKCKDNKDEKMCPPDYRELLPLFPPDYDGIFKVWYDKEDPDGDGFVEMTKEEKEEYLVKKKAEFRKFIVDTIEMDKEGIDIYLNKIVNGRPTLEAFYFNMYGEGKRKKNKTKKGILRRNHTKRRNKKSTNKKSTNKKSTNKKSKRK